MPLANVTKLALLLCLILLGGCQATVTYYSDPPGAYASGYNNKGEYYRFNLPVALHYNYSALPKGFPATCGVVNTPSFTWPDGVTKSSETINLCYKDANYTSKKPQPSNPPVSTYTPTKESIKTSLGDERQNQTKPVTQKSSAPQSREDPQKKCLRMGLIPGSDDYNLCFTSQK